MRKPFEHTLTPTERAIFNKWLVGVSVFYASIALIAFGCVIVSQNFSGGARTDTAAMSGTR
jgi:hypothetical protein